MFIPSPLAHQTGFLYGMWLSFVLGVPQILQPVWDPVRALNLLQGWKGSFVQAATPFLADLVKAVEAGAAGPGRACGSSSTPVPAFPGTSPNGPPGCWARGSAGRSAPPKPAWAQSPPPAATRRWSGAPTDSCFPGCRPGSSATTGSCCLPAAEGNFELLSPTMFEGYLDRPDLTKEAFTDDGWYRTGDLATLDDAGYLRITGRVRDVINRGGEKIPVAEIEQLLYRHPAVDDVALAAMPDPRLGERACAFVVPVAGSCPHPGRTHPVPGQLPGLQALLAGAAGAAGSHPAEPGGQGPEIPAARAGTATGRECPGRHRQEPGVKTSSVNSGTAGADGRGSSIPEPEYQALLSRVTDWVEGPGEAWAEEIEATGKVSG